MKTIELHTKLVRTPPDVSERVTVELADDETVVGVQHHAPFFAVLIAREVKAHAHAEG